LYSQIRLRMLLRTGAEDITIWVATDVNTKLPFGTLDKLWADSHNWRAGLIYVCKDDPRFVVPKRNKWSGWTLNFAHPSAWLALLVCLLSLIVPTICFALAGLMGTAIWYVFLVGIAVFWCAFSWVLSSPKRYEDAA
jgi:hypothetical protein